MEQTIFGLEKRIVPLTSRLQVIQPCAQKLIYICPLVGCDIYRVMLQGERGAEIGVRQSETTVPISSLRFPLKIYL